jgi:hypothetical protein
MKINEQCRTQVLPVFNVRSEFQKFKCLHIHNYSSLDKIKLKFEYFGEMLLDIFDGFYTELQSCDY